jgi:hypothetical protein
MSSSLKRYLEYLEAAFLIRRINRVDNNAQRFRRATTFKVYLTNPSMRAALFGPVDEKDDVAMGGLTETAIFSQWIHNADFIDRLHYARWKSGEVDLVACDDKMQKPQWIVEVKWTDRFFNKPGELKPLLEFWNRNRSSILEAPLVTTKTKEGGKDIHFDGPAVTVHFSPSSVYCYTVGRNVTTSITGRAFMKKFPP